MSRPRVAAAAAALVAVCATAVAHAQDYPSTAGHASWRRRRRADCTACSRGCIGPEARAAVRQAVHGGEPARRELGGRRTVGRARRARRLHAHGGDQLDHGDQRHPVQVPALRSADRSRAGRPDRARAGSAGGQRRPAGAFGRRSREARPKATPGGLHYGSAGPGTAQHLGGEMLKAALGVATDATCPTRACSRRSATSPAAISR